MTSTPLSRGDAGNDRDLGELDLAGAVEFWSLDPVRDPPQSVREAPGPKGSNKSVLKRGASTSLLLQTGGIGLQYATQVVLARALGVNRFGTYTYAVTWTRLAGSVAHLGGASSSLRLLPEYEGQQRWSLAAGVIRRFRQVAIVVGLVVALVGSAVVLGLDGTSTNAVALTIALWLVPVAALIELQVALARGFQLIFRAFFPWLVLQPIVLVAGVAVYLAFGGDLDVQGALVITAVSYLVTIALQAWWLRTSVPSQIRTASPSFEPRAWVKLTFPIFGSNVVYMVFSRLDVVMVGILRSPREAGIYAVAMRAGTFVSILETAMAATLAPRISKLYWSDRKDEVEHAVLMAVRWIFLPTLGLTIVLCVFSRQALGVFGKGFAAGSTVLVLISLGQLVSVSSGAVGWLMNMTGHQNVTAVVFAAVAAVTVVAYLVLIPWLGINGAAIANGGAAVAVNLTLNYLVRRRMGYRISVLRAMAPAR